MISEAEFIRNNESEEYNLYANNCGHQVSQITSAGGVQYGKESELSPQTVEISSTIGIVNMVGINHATQSGQGVIVFGSYLLGLARQEGTMPNVVYESEIQHTEGVSGDLSVIYEEIEVTK